jgi:hypothetical protein
MDHLALVDGSISPLQLDIPVVANDYDGGDFFQYGYRRGFESLLELIDVHKEQPDLFNSIVQTWLFFGLIHEMFGPVIDISGFTMDNGSEKRISTALLAEHCNEWLQKVDRADDRQRANADHVELHEPYVLAEILDQRTYLQAFITKKNLDRLHKSIAFAWKLSHQLDEAIQCEWFSDSRKILVSIKLLVEALRACLDHAVDLFQPLWTCCCLLASELPEVLIYKRLPNHPSVFLTSYLVEKGWCPFRLSAISSTSPTQSLYMLTAFESEALIGNKHGKCTIQACREDNSPNNGVEHASSCADHGSCRLIQVPVEKLVEIYNSDAVPVLSCARGPSGTLDVEVVSSAEHPDFDAISHVWSDGLKNDAANALFECQLSPTFSALGRLDRFINSKSKTAAVPYSSRAGQFVFLTRPDPIVASNSMTLPGLEEGLASHTLSHGPQVEKMWLDILCIPRGSSPEEYSNERRRAIEKIDWTFARARRVLVRDKILNNLRTENMSTMEIAVYLCCAKWLRRCWTLAEGALAWDFTIQFADRTMGFLDILKMAEPPFEPNLVARGHYRAGNQEEFKIVLQRRLQTGLLAAFQRIPYSKENKKWEDRSFSKSWNALSARSTSWPTDIPLILGLVMKVPIIDLTKFNHSLRMKAILKTFARIPVALLFNKSPKLDAEPRNRWVPTNLGSADRLEPGPLMGLYNEGRMVGPIMARMFTMFTFRASGQRTFELVESESRDAWPSRKFLVNLRESLGPTHEQEWCLVLPYAYDDSNWLRTVHCVGFCATVRRKRGKYVLLQWQSLADVTCSRNFSRHATLSLEGFPVPSSSEVFIESGTSYSNMIASETSANRIADMADWPNLPSLNEWLGPEQDLLLSFVFSLPDYPKYRFWFIAMTITHAAALLSWLTADNPYLVAIGALTTLPCMIFWLLFPMLYSGVRRKNSSPWRGRAEYGGRQAFEEYSDQEQHAWAEIFAAPASRQKRSIRYRFLQWARFLPSTRNFKPGRTTDIAYSRLNVKLWNILTIPPAWFARSHSLLRLAQFLLAILQTPLAYYMFGPLEDDEDSTARDAFMASFILFLSPCTAIWAAMGWADAKKALPTHSNLYTHPEDQSSGAQNRQKIDIVLVPLWYPAFISAAKCAASVHGSHLMAILMTFSTLAMLFVRLNI